jgi:alpha-ketoglutarate-dependent taurine dioxygenase
MARLTAKNLTPYFGAEVCGLEPSVPLDAETIAELRTLFDDKGVLVFKNVDVDIKFQTYLSEILIGNDVPDPDALKLNDKFLISNREPTAAAPYGRLLYHSDQMWSGVDRVDMISLYGQEVGQPATPTMFISAAHAWNSLPQDLKSRVEGAQALQHYDPETYRKRAAGDEDVLVSTYAAAENFTVQPVALIHPRTGRKVLYVCQQTTQHIEGLPIDESDRLLDALFHHMYADERQLAHAWEQKDLVVWDNIAIQHARPNVATEGPPRTLRKTMAPMPKAKMEGPKYGSLTAAA